MTLLPTRSPPRLRCRKCGSTRIVLTGATRGGLKTHHHPDLSVECADCNHSWYSKARAASALRYVSLEELGQGVITWDEMPLKKTLTRPPLPE